MTFLIITFLLSILIPISHIFLSWKFNFLKLKSKLFISLFLYLIFWFAFTLLFFHNIETSYRVASLSLIIFLYLGYLEFYSMICRGFSLQILSDIKQNGNLSKEEISLSYANGKGIDWMIDKRINSIINLKLIYKENYLIALNNKISIFLTIFSIVLKKLFNLGKGGE